MNWADYAIVGIVAVSALISLWRGFVREALSLAAWIAAFWVALAFSERLAGALAAHIATPSVRLAVAFGILFLGTLLVGGLINWGAGRLVDRTGLTGTDRVMGMLFGVARGVAVVAVLVLLAGLTPLPDDPWWRESALLPHFVRLALWLRELLPPEVASSIRL